MRPKIKRLVSQVNTYFSSNDNCNHIIQLMKEYVNDPIINIPTGQCNSIAFVAGGINRFGGGTTSILRIGTYLSMKGMQVTYVIYNQSVDTAKENASFALPEVQGVFVEYSKSLQMKYDFVVATWWESVYKAIKVNGYKLYFVQDYEPLFYGMSEEYLLSKNTYELGLHIVSLGEWNLKMIERFGKENERKKDYISFPYEPSEYKNIEHDFFRIKKDKSINIAVYMRSVGKRIPYLLQWFLGELKRTIETEWDNYKVNINYFGVDSRFPLVNGNNLGKLSKEDLYALYAQSDFGVVASMTNVSLVPYEMIASGIPVIDFEEGSYTSFLPKDSALICDFNPYKLANRMKELIINPQKIEDLVQYSQSQINNLSWKRTTDEFYSILEEISKS